MNEILNAIYDWNLLLIYILTLSINAYLKKNSFFKKKNIYIIKKRNIFKF